MGSCWAYFSGIRRHISALTMIKTFFSSFHNLLRVMRVSSKWTLNSEFCYLHGLWMNCGVKHWVIIKYSQHNKNIIVKCKFCLIIDHAVNQLSSLFYIVYTEALFISVLFEKVYSFMCFALVPTLKRSWYTRFTWTEVQLYYGVTFEPVDGLFSSFTSC